MKRFLLIAVGLWGLTALTPSSAQERWKTTAPQTITWQPQGNARCRFDIHLERTSGQQLRLTIKEEARVVCQRNLRGGQTVEIRL